MGYVVTNVLIAVACVLFLWKNHIPRDVPGFSVSLVIAGACGFLALGRVVQLIWGRDKPAAQQMQRYVVAIGVWSVLACLAFWLSDSEGLGILLNVNNPYGHIPLDLVLKLRWAVVALSFPFPILIAYWKGKRALAHPDVSRGLSPAPAAPINWVLVGMFFPFSLVFLPFLKARRARALSVSSPPGTIDPNKWSFDPDTGEYYEVTFSHKEGRLLSRETYHERVTTRLANLQHYEPNLLAFRISSAIFGISLLALFLAPDHSIMAIGSTNVGMLAFIALCAAVGMLASGGGVLAYGSQLKDVGPKPVPLRAANPDDMADFKNQKALGAAGVASPAEVHQALARKSAPPAPPRRFED